MWPTEYVIPDTASPIVHVVGCHIIGHSLQHFAAQVKTTMGMSIASACCLVYYLPFAIMDVVWESERYYPYDVSTMNAVKVT